MDEPDGNDWVGRYVLVTSGGTNVYTGGRNSEFGVLEARDDAFLYVRRADGELVILPLTNVRQLQLIETPPQIPGGTLLRPSSEDGQLLRPAAPAPSSPERLLRPDAEPSNAARSPAAAPWWQQLLLRIIRTRR